MSSLPALYLRGLVMGFAIAAPVGAIGVLCIRRTLAGGWPLGLATGLGAATADAVYGAIAAFGISAVSALLLGVRGWLQVVGGAFLIYLGVRTFLATPTTECDEGASRSRGLGGAWASTFVLTLGNPTTIMSFAAVFAGLGVGAAGAGGPGSAVALVAGVFSGSALWWVLLSVTVGLVRHRLDATAMSWVNRASGVMIGGFGVLALVAGVVVTRIAP